MNSAEKINLLLSKGFKLYYVSDSGTCFSFESKKEDITFKVSVYTPTGAAWSWRRFITD